MELFNLLDTAIPVFGQTYDISLNWIGQLIRLLISGVGVVGVGIILFSLILKLVVLPFDVYQRIAMRKQNQKMKEQQERMEKLQKQYANDKEKYNQKLMEMYKENGISMFSSCLPMILSMVIFFVAIGAFNTYSQYSSIENYNTLVNAYNTEVFRYCPALDTAEISFTEDNKITVKGAAEDKDAYLYYTVVNNGYTAETSAEEVKAYILATPSKTYLLDEAKISADADFVAEFTASGAENYYDYFVNKAQDAVVTAYEENVTNRTSFLWIKNIWVTDASYKSPITEYSEFEAGLTRYKFQVGDKKVNYSDIGAYTGLQVYSEDAYNLITKKLETQKEEANGYYVLILLSIGTILLQQFVSMRSQKEQQKYSSVDGQGAANQKMMMIMMTVMFAFFSFMYSSAFSIYMIMSNVFSLISTLVINYFVDNALDKKAAVQESARLDKRNNSRIEAAKNAGKASAQSTRERKSEKEDKSSK